MQTDGQVARSTIIFASITRVRASFPSFATNFFFPMVFISIVGYTAFCGGAQIEGEKGRKEKRRKEKFEKRKKDERVSLA